MARLIRFTDRLLNASLSLLMAALLLDILWQVASRYLLNDPSSMTEEIARFLLLWIGLLGGCYAYRHGSHLGLNLLTEKMNAAAKTRAQDFVQIIVMAFALLVLCYGGGQLVWLTLDLQQTSPALGISMGYIYSVLPLSGCLILFYGIALWRTQHLVTEAL